METKKKPRKKYYVQPEDLRLEILNFQETGEASERLGEMLIQIATGLAASSKFDQRTYRDDMAGDAVLRMYKNLNLIDTTDPTDLHACCQRDFENSAKVKFSKTTLDDEFRASAKNPKGMRQCIITDYVEGSDVCELSFFKMKKKKVLSWLDDDATIPELNEQGKQIKIEIEEMVITSVKEDVPLEKVLFRKTNPFSYLTMIAYRVYLGRCDKENKRDKAVDAYREECYSEFEAAECISNRSPSEGDMDMGFDYYDQESKPDQEK
jgi:hypothetical protein